MKKKSNAQIGDEPRVANLYIRVEKKQKELFVSQAKKENKSLSQWVIEKLEAK